MKLAFVGDIALGDHPKAVGFGFYSTYRTGIPEAKARGLLPEGLKPDVLFGNLEFTVGDRDVKGNTVKDVQCRGTDRFVGFLKAAEFDILNVANNHMYEHGMQPFSKTIENVRAVGIQTCGTPGDFEKGSIMKVGDEKLAVLGWSNRPRQGFEDAPPYNELGDIEACLRKIREAREAADVVCVSVHWGEEYVQVPSREERSIAQRMIDNGALLVIGHHPHVLREIEEYHGGLIAYSLGNFICDISWNEKARETGCLSVEIDKGRLEDWTFHPGMIGDDFFPAYFDETEGQRFTAALASRIADLKRSAESPRDYEALAGREMRTHQLLSLLFFIRNLYRYRPRFAWSIFRDAFLSRIG
jgi:poly-gamma-glutamate synthesis protein (capsule biosynthesis protein)